VVTITPERPKRELKKIEENRIPKENPTRQARFEKGNGSSQKTSKTASTSHPFKDKTNTVIK
jgi:hypothetical protein